MVSALAGALAALGGLALAQNPPGRPPPIKILPKPGPVAQPTGPITIGKAVQAGASLNINPYGGKLNSGRRVEVFECLGINRPGDNYQAGTSPDGRTARITCAQPMIDGSPRNGTVEVTFTESARQRTTATSAKFRLASSRAIGVDGCAQLFQSYKTQPARSRFVATWGGLGLTCEARGNGITTNLSVSPLIAAAMARANELSVQGLAVPRRYRPPDDNFLYEFSGTLYLSSTPQNGPGAAQISWFTRAPHGLKGAYVQVFRGAAPPNIAMSCKNWIDTPNVAHFSFFPLVEQKVTPSFLAVELRGNEPEGLSGWRDPHFTIGTLNQARINELRAGLGPNQIGWMRVIPSRDGMPGVGLAGTCATSPTGWIKVDTNPTPSEQFVANMQAMTAARAAFNAEANAAYQAAYNAHKAGGLKAPAVAAPMSFIPPHDVNTDTLVALPFTAPKMINATSQQLQDPNAWSVSNTFKLGGHIPWDNAKRNWTAGCAFSVSALHEAVMLGPAGPSSVFEWITTIWNVYAAIYDMMKSFAVEGLTYVMSAGQCPFQDPTKPPSSQPAACSGVKTAVRAGLEYAMSTVGLPPSLPSSSSLLEDGAEYLAREAVGYGLEQVAGPLGQDVVDSLPDQTREAAVGIVRDNILKAADIAKCPYPATSLNDALAKGYTSYNPITGCGIVSGAGVTDFRSIGEYPKRASGGPDHALVWVQVAPFTGIAAPGKMVRVTVDVPTANLGGPMTPRVREELLKTNGLRLYESVSFEVDSGRIGQNAKIPVMLLRSDMSVWLNAMQRANGDYSLCANNAFIDGCLKGHAEAAWRNSAETAQSLRIGFNYQWTSDPKLLKPCKDVKVGGSSITMCAEFDGRHNIANTFTQPLNRVGIGTYGVNPPPAACPGMRNVQAPSGLWYTDLDIPRDNLKLD